MSQEVPPWTHAVSYRLQLAAGGDERAPGGAVTVELCGHWEHEGLCRWPHYTSIEPTEDGAHRVTVEVAVPASEAAMVLDRIRSALMGGELLGPDGRTTRWVLLD